MPLPPPKWRDKLAATSQEIFYLWRPHLRDPKDDLVPEAAVAGGCAAMSTLSLRIPESLHRELRALARRERVSINQVISSAVGGKVASLKTLDYLRERARRGDRLRFEQVLAKVPGVEPEEADRLPDAALRQAASRRRARHLRRPNQ